MTEKQLNWETEEIIRVVMNDEYLYDYLRRLAVPHDFRQACAVNVYDWYVGVQGDCPIDFRKVDFDEVQDCVQDQE